MNCKQLYASTIILLGIAFHAAQADTVRLVNGDTLSGDVKSLDDQKLVITSDVLGELSIQRSKIQAIQLGDAAIPSDDAPTDQPSQSTADSPRQDLPQQAGGKATPAARGEQTPEQVVEQLRTQGIDQKQLDMIKRQFPLLGSTKAGGYFDKTVGGLVDGTIDVQDIRKDAIDARDQLKDLQKDLGPQGKALNGYLNILEGFIEETAPKEEPLPENSDR